MAMGMAIATVTGSSNVHYRAVNVVALLSNGSGARIETINAKLHSSTENYECGRYQFNLYTPRIHEHIGGFRQLMEKFIVKRVRFF